jgi:hypothetical protein
MADIVVKMVVPTAGSLLVSMVRLKPWSKGRYFTDFSRQGKVVLGADARGS